jgi:hypothetical protein
MTIYECRFDFDTIRIRCDFSEASSPIEYAGDGGEWHSTPYQCADARHSATRAAEIVTAYLGSDYWRSPDSDDDREDGEIIHDLVAAAGVEPVLDEDVEDDEDVEK